jgi:hypothetical protein
MSGGCIKSPLKRDLLRKQQYERVSTHNDMAGVVSAVTCSYYFEIDNVRFVGYNTMKSIVAKETAGGTGRTINGR